MDGRGPNVPMTGEHASDSSQVARLPPADAVHHYHKLFLDQPTEFARTYVGNAQFRAAVHACSLALVQQHGYTPTLVRVPPAPLHAASAAALPGFVTQKVSQPQLQPQEQQRQTQQQRAHPQSSTSLGSAPSIPSEGDSMYAQAASLSENFSTPGHAGSSFPAPVGRSDATALLSFAQGSQAQAALSPDQSVYNPSAIAPSVQRLLDEATASLKHSQEYGGGAPSAGMRPHAAPATGYPNASLPFGTETPYGTADGHRPAHFSLQQLAQVHEQKHMGGVAPSLPSDGASASPTVQAQLRPLHSQDNQLRRDIPRVQELSRTARRETTAMSGSKLNVPAGRRPSGGFTHAGGGLHNVSALAGALPAIQSGDGLSNASIHSAQPTAVGVAPGSGRRGAGPNSRGGLRESRDRSVVMGRAAGLASRPTRVTPRTMDPLPKSPTAATAPAHVFELLNRQAWELFDQIRPEDSESDRRARLLAHMNKVVKSEWPDSYIRMFGSGASGLNLRGGDVDMCLMVPPQPQQRRQRRPRRNNRGAAVGRGAGSEDNSSVSANGGFVSDKQIMRTMVGILRRSRMTIIQELPAARVPIVKVSDPVSNFRLDVCLNNELGHHNTSLLKAYTSMDTRVRAVCLLIKHWAKRRDINDAYRGTLSSYAYVLLIVHYLQTRERPVLPCLQEMHLGRRVTAPSQRPSKIVVSQDGVKCDVHFDPTVSNFDAGNRDSLGELLVGFFHYYAFEFKYTEHIASVRLGGPIARTLNGWDESSVSQELQKAEAQILEESEKEARNGKRSRRNKGSANSGHGPKDAVRPSFGLQDEDDFPSLGSDAPAKQGNSVSNRADPPGYSQEPTATGSGEMPLRPGVVPQSTERDSEGEDEEVENAEARREAISRKLRKVTRHVFCIEDPFDLSHDLGRNLDSETLDVIRHEFVRAHAILISSGDLHRMLEKYSG